MSLGYNCEVTQRLNQLFAGKFDHYLYSWSYEYDRELFLDSLRHLPDFNGEYYLLSSGMFMNELYKIAFHSKFDKKKLLAAQDSNSENISSAIKELKSRVSYLAQKTEKIFSNNKKALFILKLKYTDFAEDKNYIEALRDVINSKYSIKNNFTLLVVISRQDFLEKTEDFCNLQIPNVEVKAIEYFAADNQTLDGGDIEGWLNLIKTTCQ